MALLRLSVCVLFAGCGTLAPEGGGATDLPVSGAGPYKLLAPNDAYPFVAPIVLSDAGADLDDAYVLSDGDLIGTWVTYTVNHTSEIRHADFLSLETGSTGFIDGVTPAEPWEGNRVAQPAVLWTAPWLLFYAGEGGIGYATADDGHKWVKAPGPALAGAFSSPAAIRLDDGTVRLFYLADDGIHAADAAFADLAARAPEPFHPRDGVVLAPFAAPWLAQLGRFSARTVVTPAGRRRYDLFLTGVTGAAPPAGEDVGFASSFDGLRFEVAATPFLDARTASWSPSATEYRAGSLLLVTRKNGQHTAIAAALSP